MDTLLDISANRVIQLQDRGRTFTVYTRRVEKEDWLDYFAAMRITSERVGAQTTSTIDVETPRLRLAERVIIDAEGYAVRGGGKLTELPNWQQRLPLAHRRQVAIALADVQPSAALDDEFAIWAEGEEISLDATWSLGANGKMQRFQGLKHIFKSPTAAQHKRYNDAASRSMIVGGSRTAKTVYPSVAALLCELYDELIEEVNGYLFFGDFNVAPRSMIIAQMDCHHKLTAAQELFAPTAGVTLGGVGSDDEE